MQNATFSLRSKSKRIDLSRPIVMGVLNATPDSFYKESRISNEEQAVFQATQMLKEGATVLDIGGYSSRPGAENITDQEELNRVLPIIQAILTAHPDAILSIDTFRASVANASLEAGAALINDISGGAFDDQLLTTVAKWKVPYVLMHMHGTLKDMQDKPNYVNLMLEMLQYFDAKIAHLKEIGIYDIVIDPGFGFGKTQDDNYRILAQLRDLKALGFPLLVGVSRKSMIYKALEISPAEALNGTSAVHMLALERGALILRAHNVKEAVECVRIFELTKAQAL